jgi:hypothetical protein
MALAYSTARESKRGHMLILTRRINETLTIGREITVTVMGVKGTQERSRA